MVGSIITHITYLVNRFFKNFSKFFYIIKIAVF